VDKALRSLVDWYARVGVDVPDLAPIVPVRKAKTERRLPTAKQEKVSVSQKPSPNEDAPRPLSTDVAAKCKTLDELRAAMQSFDAGFLSDGASFYITNVVNWRLPKNRNPKPEEIALCRPFLDKHCERN